MHASTPLIHLRFTENDFAVLLSIWVGVACLFTVMTEGDSHSSRADGPNGGSSSYLLLGMSTALSGPAADLGKNMQAGVLAAFHEVNLSGGIHGRQLRLISLDDGYEPARAAPNMRSLIESEHAIAVIGNVGTPTAIAAIPIANATHTPFFGAFTGAGVLRKTPPDRFVINYRASYAEETAAMVDALVEYGGLIPEEVAFFTQRDGYGDAGFVGGITALKRHGLREEDDVAHGRYERNTLAVEKGLADILLHEPFPKAVIMVGAYAPCARFIKLAKRVEYEGLFLNVSFVGSVSLAEALGPEGEGVIVTQVVPHPESDLPIAVEYRAALRQWEPDAVTTFGSFEGYVAARILRLALETIPDSPTGEKIAQSLEELGEFSLGFNQPLKLSPSEHQASHCVWPTILRNGKVVPYKWSELEGTTPGKWK